MLLRLVVFLIINFGALAIGGYFTNDAVTSDWYLQMDKAPWTPPGWVFGAAWTSIMICFSIYLAYLWPKCQNKNLLLGLYLVQLILNIGWNLVFFYYHNIFGGLMVISGLTLLIGFLLFYYFQKVKWLSLLLVPYVLWLVIATSLNAYIFLKN